MATVLGEFSDVVTPTPADAKLAEVSSRQLAKILSGKRKRDSFSVQIKAENRREETISIPVAAFELLSHVLTEMAKGNAVTMIPVHAELTTQQAADMLNVSRPFLVEQLERGALPFHKVGTHRRIRFQDLMQYKRAMSEQREKALEEIAAQAQDLKLGY